MINTCLVCYAELSSDEEYCFNCGSLRGIKLERAPVSRDSKGILLAGASRDEAIIASESFPPGLTFSNRFTIKKSLPPNALWFRYLSVDLVRGLDVELRTLRESRPSTEGWKAMEYLQRLKGHSNIIGVFYVDFESDPPFAIFNLQKGIQLSAFLRSKKERLTNSEAIRIIQELLFGLATLHKNNFAHSDIHPDSIWLDAQGRPRLDAGGAFERSSVSIYASPEQYMGGESSPQSDIYSIGLLWYRLLVGTLPFATLAEEDIRSYSSQKYKNLAPLSPRLSVVVRRLLSDDLKKRPNNADELLKLLQRRMTSGWIPVPEKVKSELINRGSPSRFYLGDQLIAATDALQLIRSGSAMGTAALHDGHVVLRTSIASLAEAGLLDLLPVTMQKEFSIVSLLHACIVADVSNKEALLKQQPAKDIEEQVELAKVAHYAGFSAISRARMGAAIQACKSSQDWCFISKGVFYFGDSNASKAALNKGMTRITTIEDVLELSSCLRWQHDDKIATKQLLSRGASLVGNASNALDYASAWIALLNDTKSAQVVLGTVIEMSLSEPVLSQCESLYSTTLRFGKSDIWEQWLHLIEQKASSHQEWRRISWLWKHLGDGANAQRSEDQYRASLSLWRDAISEENKVYGIDLELPDLVVDKISAYESTSLLLREEIQATEKEGASGAHSGPENQEEVPESSSLKEEEGQRGDEETEPPKEQPSEPELTPAQDSQAPALESPTVTQSEWTGGVLGIVLRAFDVLNRLRPRSLLLWLLLMAALGFSIWILLI
jgi:serine/threonine protein kinase